MATRFLRVRGPFLRRRAQVRPSGTTRYGLLRPRGSALRQPPSRANTAASPAPAAALSAAAAFLAPACASPSRAGVGTTCSTTAGASPAASKAFFPAAAAPAAAASSLSSAATGATSVRFCPPPPLSSLACWHGNAECSRAALRFIGAVRLFCLLPRFTEHVPSVRGRRQPVLDHREQHRLRLLRLLCVVTPRINHRNKQ